MGKIDSFEDLKCWTSARVLTRRIYQLCSAEPLASDYRLSNQLTSAAVSAMTNIAEGFARYHRGDFIRFLDISQSSTAEVKSLLYVVSDQEYASADTVASLQEQCDTTQALTLGLLRYVKKRQGEPHRTREPDVQYASHAAPPELSLPDNYLDV